MRYRSKIDWWLLLIVFIPMGWPVIEGIITGDLTLTLIFIVANALLVWMFASTYYTINGNMLIIRCGFFGRQKIAIGDITCVKTTSNPLSAPALSLKRLEIKYGRNYDYALVSPVRKDEFVEHLLKINPDIQVTI
ncbi:PH domain-containing protein [Flavobacterium sp. MK4S-17]|uniref:PH domain-containing protein n=1 Tax=Flavobacterium sp. MK4S-17 TaxID=2543737 RepID=UPI001359AC30|nr:PH domain-containing protein [Flavobacterium sp. MK4S-17]